MAWLTANSLPKYWFNYPSDSNDQAPQWGITDTGGYGTNPYAIAVSNVGYSSQPARLLSNKFDVPLAGATISFKLYIPTVSDGVAYTVSIHDAVGGASLAVTGLTAGAGWKECSVLLTQGARCLEFRVTPDMYTDTFPKFVLDEVISYVDGVQANLLEAGGLGFAFPPGHQIPYGWENTGLTPFEAAYEGNVPHTRGCCASTVGIRLTLGSGSCYLTNSPFHPAGLPFRVSSRVVVTRGLGLKVVSRS